MELKSFGQSNGQHRFDMNNKFYANEQQQQQQQLRTCEMSFMLSVFPVREQR